MAGVSLLETMSYVSLTKALQERKPGIPNPWPDDFFRRKSEPVLGNVARSTVYYGSRRVARETKFGAPARRRNKSKLGIQDVMLLHTREEEVFDPYVLLQLRAADKYTRDRGETEVARQIDDAKTELMNLRIATLTSFMTIANAYFDADGTLLKNSSGAILTVPWQVPANNLNQLNSGIPLSWDSASAQIPTDVITLKARALKETGFALENVYYGVNGPRYLTQNNSLKDYLYRNEPKNADYLDTGEIPRSMLGLEWYPVYGVQYEDQAGTTNDFVNDDVMTFTPKVESWYDMMEGTYPVPRRMQVYNDPMAMLDDLEEMPGMFAYGVLTADPSIKLNFGDTFLPWAKNGRAIYIATVKF